MMANNGNSNESDPTAPKPTPPTAKEPFDQHLTERDVEVVNDAMAQQTITNDAVAGETVLPGVSERVADSTDGPIHPIYAKNDLAGEEIDLKDSHRVARHADTAASAKPTPSGIAGYDAEDGNEALPDFDEGEHGVRGAVGPGEDAINISESDGPDLQRDH